MVEIHELTLLGPRITEEEGKLKYTPHPRPCLPGQSLSYPGLKVKHPWSSVMASQGLQKCRWFYRD